MGRLDSLNDRGEEHVSLCLSMLRSVETRWEGVPGNEFRGLHVMGDGPMARARGPMDDAWWRWNVGIHS